MDYLPKLATIEQACEWLGNRTNEKWILSRLIECGLRPYFWLDYAPNMPQLFGNRIEGYLSEMIFNGDTVRLEAVGTDAIVNMLTAHDGTTAKIEPSWRLPLSELRFKREEIEETAKLINDEKNNANASIELSAAKKRGISKTQALEVFEEMVKPQNLRKFLTNKPNWIKAACLDSGKAGSREGIWCPVLLALALVEIKNVPKFKLDKVFQNGSLTNWQDEWESKSSFYAFKPH